MKPTAIKKETEQILMDFAEYCHERYLGCSQNKSSKTDYEYAYEKEVVGMVEDYLNDKK